jgi:hypothetical protein
MVVFQAISNGMLQLVVPSDVTYWTELGFENRIRGEGNKVVNLFELFGYVVDIQFCQTLFFITAFFVIKNVSTVL